MATTSGFCYRLQLTVAAFCILTATRILHIVPCRRCLCEWLRDDAISKGLAAAATGGARAAVQAAVAAERHEVGCEGLAWLVIMYQLSQCA